MSLKELEIICRTVLKRKDINSEEREFWNKRLEWLEAQKQRDAE
jgi:hypothetical protein